MCRALCSTTSPTIRHCRPPQLPLIPCQDKRHAAPRHSVSMHPARETFPLHLANSLIRAITLFFLCDFCDPPRPAPVISPPWCSDAPDRQPVRWKGFDDSNDKDREEEEEKDDATSGDQKVGGVWETWVNPWGSTCPWGESLAFFCF